MEIDEEKENEDEDETKDDKLKVYLPGQALEQDEVLEVDQSAYEMLHSMDVQWPCLSFDVLWDRLGEERKSVGMICGIRESYERWAC